MAPSFRPRLEPVFKDCLGNPLLTHRRKLQKSSARSRATSLARDHVSSPVDGQTCKGNGKPHFFIFPAVFCLHNIQPIQQYPISGLHEAIGSDSFHPQLAMAQSATPPSMRYSDPVQYEDCNKAEAEIELLSYSEPICGRLLACHVRDPSVWDMPAAQVTET